MANRRKPQDTVGHRFSSMHAVGSNIILFTFLLSSTCLSTCFGFQTVSSRPMSIKTSIFSSNTMARRSHHSLLDLRRAPKQSATMISTRMSIFNSEDNKMQDSMSYTSTLSSTKLFPQRKSSSSKLQMSTSSDGDSSKGTSEDKSSSNPLVKAWLSFRKLLAKLWALLLKPFQLLKSTPKTKDKDEAAATTTTTTENKDVQEEVAITEVENIAAMEDDVEDKEETTTNVDTTEASVAVIENHFKATDIAEVAVEKTQERQEEKVSSSTFLEEEPIIAKPDKKAKMTAAVTTSTSSSRQAISEVDLTGNWTLIVDEHFSSQYDEYLRKLGQPALVRTVALTVIGSTKEETIQSDGGQKLFIRGMNVRGSWERTLEASEQVIDDADIEDGHAVVEGHELNPMTTADREEVSVASWWEASKDGTPVHHSWVVGGKKYGGGDFENKRYLTDDGNILVCESTFHPEEEGRDKAGVTWRFLREGAIYGDAALQLPNPFDLLKKEEKEDTKKKTPLPKSDVIVGDIMDDVTTSNAEKELSTTDTDTTVTHSLSIEEAIERESWVPPAGSRWAIAAPGVDLTGKWKLIITEQFKKDYDDFLTSLGQPIIVRAAANVIIGNTREETKQRDAGRELYIKGINAKGIWERALTSSGSDYDETMQPGVDGKYPHIQVPIVTADSEKVVAESWWEDDGRMHVSWTYGGTRYGGGDFESKRYLENDGNVYVCESTFHPTDAGREKSYLKWKFLREGAAFMLRNGQ